jgi:hypothetical protein
MPAGSCCARVALDGNANALDTGLEAVVAFLRRADEAFAARRAWTPRSSREETL